MSRRRQNPDFGTKDLLVVGGVAAAAYFIYQMLQKVPKVATAATAPVANAIAGGIMLWNRLVTSPPMGGVLGDVVLADGTDVGPLAGMNIRTDSQGNVYVMMGQTVYQLGQSDANGNWPATPVGS